MDGTGDGEGIRDGGGVKGATKLRKAQQHETQQPDQQISK